jgi:hypothetical protein
MSVDVRWLLLACAVLLLGGAKRVRLVDPIEWAEFVEFAPPTGSELVGGTAAALVLAGDLAPHDGWVLPGRSFHRLAEGYTELSKALDSCYIERRRDRFYADAVHGSTIEGLRTARREQGRAYLMGVATGVGGCGAVIGGARALVP